MRGVEGLVLVLENVPEPTKESINSWVLPCENPDIYLTVAPLFTKEQQIGRENLVDTT